MQTELLVHYLQHTSRTFGALSTHSQAFWRTVVPALAYTSVPVRLGMLTMAALCLSNETQSVDIERSETYLQAAEHYGQQFVEKCSDNVETLGQCDAGEQLACSRLLAILALAWFRVRRQRGSVRLVDAEAWNWLHMLRGSATLHHCHMTGAKKVTEAKNVVEFLANELAADGSGAATSESFKSSLSFQFFAESRKARFDALYDAVALRCTSLGAESATDILSAIEHLEQITEELCSGHTASLVRTLCFWPCRMSKGFADLLVQGNALALAVHAHWLMAVALVQDAWYVEGMGHAGIEEINQMLVTMRNTETERSLLDWPRRIIEQQSFL